MGEFVKLNNIWIKVRQPYMKVAGGWYEMTENQMMQYFTSDRVFLFGSENSGVVHTLEIVGTSAYTSEFCSFTSIYDGVMNVSSASTWSVINGSEYITNDINGGEFVITPLANNSNATIQAAYNGYTTTKDIVVTYRSGSQTETETNVVVDESGNTTTTTTTTTTDEDGTVTTQTTTTSTDENGNLTGTTETNVIVNEDGTSSATTTTNTLDENGNVTGTTESNVITNESGGTSSTTITTTMDESGNTIGSSENNTETNPDGSYSSNTTNYDSGGSPTTSVGETGDTSGNVSTQDITYDESGNSVVTGYEIDTSSNPDGEKTFNQDGVNTEFYGFDVTQGFIMNIHFTLDYSNQPPGQNENHHQIVTMKRATPEPWYGFQLRQTSNNKYIVLGTQFETGSNVNTNIYPNYVSGSTTVTEHDLQVIYDPTVSSNNFVCKDLINGNIIYSANKLFPDLPELRYLTVCIGYGLDSNADPYRYSNINVLNFSIIKLSNEVSEPEISCNGQYVTIDCETPNATIYYKFNYVGNYSTYSSPLRISADTIVESYAQKGSVSSDVVSALCVYDVIESPVVYCDGEEITLTCETPSVDILYRLNQTGSFVVYDSPISISADTVIETYAQLDGKVSDTVIETCVYSPSSLVAPVIHCDGKKVTITCITQDSDIYYRLNQSGNFMTYVSAITISADTVVESYSYLSGETSSVVMENCIYNPIHDYSLDYLTFRIISGGTIGWKHYKTAVKTIEYSINDGPWVSVTSTTGGTSIQVSQDDVVRFRGTNATYAIDKNTYAGFEGGTALYDVEGNIHSLLYGDNFIGNDNLTDSTYQFCSLLKLSNVVSAENLILPATVLKNYCYRALFSKAYYLIKPPKLIATTLSRGCYYYMFEACPFSDAPELLATSLVIECYYNMFVDCSNLNYIKCMATTNLGVTSALTNWVKGVSANGTFVKDGNTTWAIGVNGIPTGWVICNDTLLLAPTISYDGDQEVVITCETSGASIFYRLNEIGNFTEYVSAITISATTIVEAYSFLSPQTSATITQTCEYVVETPYESSNKTLSSWTYNNIGITTPYSVNKFDGHSSSYAKGTFNFETSVNLRKTQPTYLWFQHADQSATIYVDNTLVEKHWGGYNAFFVDLTNYAHKGTNNIKVSLKNNEGNYLAPSNGDFNFNATLGNVKLFTSPVLPDMKYGYDGFHVTSDVAISSATINVATTIPSGATVVCTIEDDNYSYSATQISSGSEITFTRIIDNPHLWNGTIDPHLYTITLEIYYENELYHRYQRGYGLRFYDYVFDDTTALQSHEPYTGFLLNGSPYLLRGVCMHDDLADKANALTDSDYEQEFAIIRELGCNFIRLAHYPHPKEVYDRCDQLGIIVQTEVPCVNKLQTTMPSDYYTHLEGQYTDMVNQHYNHPCILFWGLSNETTTDDKAFGKEKIEAYTTLIKSLDQERWVGYVMSHSYNDPLGYYNIPNVDWVGGNIYVGWYIDKASNDPSSQLDTRITNTISKKNKPLAFSEYGAGGTQRCHSEKPEETTTKGNYERHDIEYQMWLHEGHVKALRNYPQLLFTAQWQLFDIAVSNRNEGYTVCLDGETTSIDDSLRRLNNKGLVERDHITKKDTFYLYKAEWSNESFVHICGKDYTKLDSRVIKCYSNDGDELVMFVNEEEIERVSIDDNIAEFSPFDFEPGSVVTVCGNTTSDTFTFDE